MSSDIPAADAHLVGQWFHSHEEDSPGLEIYRPDSFAFPPARMPRESIVLGAGGDAAVGRPGPVDRPETTTGTWHLVGDEVVVEAGDGRTLHLTVGGTGQAALVMRAGRAEGHEHDQHAGE
ncbi:hypothetical protein FNH13_15660 [Ornithinimicrobium ciconiae]|uniref:Lipocalin-like domain-containing protein n=1 Tax=Ornithinimicrobium ciconiae TaxID=2594265 RepID=A0A516GDK9_9MICO|nr:hypothetical protein [Ornithinimicrobium ciconiae]QDO89591.1 hypothetical protein FNH13_15660 [Ornithinimicrobium ciconiae]